LIRRPFTIALLSGFLLWFGASFLTSTREPWDAAAYWMLVYPAALAGCAGMGYACPQRPWRWVLALFLGQFLAMVFRHGELGGLWPLGLVMFGVLALPGLYAARFGARLAEGRIHARAR
jgi:hypothetical protein